MNKVEYPPKPLINETRIEWERRALQPWRMKIKQRLLWQRGTTCERCGEKRAVDLDEGIVPRSSMRGLPVWKRRVAFASCNLFLLCMKCNREEAHQENWSFRLACEHYGEDTVREWYSSIQMKAPRYEFMPCNA